MPYKKPDPQTQNPNHLLDRLLQLLGLKNDAALSRLMDVPPPVISKMRHYRNPVSSNFLIKAHDATGLSINELRELLYTPRDVK